MRFGVACSHVRAWWCRVPPPRLGWLPRVCVAGKALSPAKNRDGQIAPGCVDAV